MKRLSNWYCGVAILFATACLVTMCFGVLDLVLHSWWCIPQSLYGAGFGILASHLAGSTTSERALEKQREMNAELNVVVKDAAAKWINANDPRTTPMPRTPEDLLRAVAEMKK